MPSSQSADNLNVETDNTALSFAVASTSLTLGGQIDVGQAAGQNGSLSLSSTITGSGGPQVNSAAAWLVVQMGEPAP